MGRYAAFLRGINVGGHTVKMEQLRTELEALGFESVTTAINSGNVLFESGSRSASALEKKIEARLRGALGYDVDTFVRTASQVASVAAKDPFPKVRRRDGDNLHVIFLKAPVKAAAAKAVKALSTADDHLLADGREVYWLRRGKLMDATIDDRELWKLLGQSTTMRTQRTVERVRAKHAQG